MQNIHFIAIGGSAMHNLAIALHLKGLKVTGSDDEIREPSKSRLAKHGLFPQYEGWKTEIIHPQLDAVILGMHARKDNPELLKAQELGLRIYSYPEFLYEQTKNKKRVVIGGSHGKTTITSMILHVLKSQNMAFDFMVGAQIEGFDTMVHLSHEAQIAIFEGDEYLSSPIDLRPKFHLYHPHIAVLSGIAWDHINVFPTFDIYKEQFSKFIDLMEPHAQLFFCNEDKNLNTVVFNNGTENVLKVAYAIPKYDIRNFKTLVYDTEGNAYGLKIFGKHNLLNLEAARHVCLSLGIAEKAFYQSISSFTGAARRLEKIGENKNVTIYKDFAHSPSKVKATIQSINEQYQGCHTIALFELHTFSSLNADFLAEYQGSMNGVTEALVYFNPKVIEHKKLKPISKTEVKTAFDRSDLVVSTETKDVVGFLNKPFNQPTVILFMTSGNFDGLDLNLVAKEIIQIN